MRLLTSRFLVALLVLSQTWTGALRGLEFCIPVGLCEGCGLWLLAPHGHDHGYKHEPAQKQDGSGVDAEHGASVDACAHHAAHRHLRSGAVRSTQHAENPAREHCDQHANHVASNVERNVDSNDCLCHIHLQTPDDDTHRGTPPCAGFAVVACAIGVIEPWILAACLPEASACPAAWPDEDAPPRFEQVLIEATVLLV